MDLHEATPSNQILVDIENRFWRMVSSIRDYAIFMLDPQGRVATWNAGAKALKGYDSHEVIGHHYSKFYTSEENQNDQPLQHLTIASVNGRHECEGWRVRKDGSVFFAHVVITRLNDDFGNLIGFVKVTRDLTEARQVESELRKAREELEQRVLQRTEALRASEQRMRQFVEQSPYAVAMLDRNMRYIFVSRKWHGDFEMSLEDVRGLNHYDLFPEIPTHWRDVHRRCLSGAIERSDGENFVRGNGKSVWIRWEVRPWYTTDSQIGGLLIFTENISKRKKMEDALRESEQQLRMLANSIPQLAWMAHVDGSCFWYNERWYQYTGKTPEQVEGWGWQSVHHPDHLPAVLKCWEDCLQSGEPFEIEIPLRGTDGTFRWYLMQIVPLKDSQGEILRWFGTATDNDMRRKAREQLADALDARDEFLSIASHELKTPLTALKLQLQVSQRNLKQEMQKSPSAFHLTRLFEMSLRQVNSLTDLVNELLDVTRIQSGRFELVCEEFCLPDLICDVLTRFTEPLKFAKIEVQVDLASPVSVVWDRHRMEQVIVNLLSNTIKYAPGSHLTVEARREGQNILLNFKDDGPGIGKEIQERIFERFERGGVAVKVGGLGLGLYIVKKIVDAHQGTITLNKVLTSGTEFNICLPSVVPQQEGGVA